MKGGFSRKRYSTSLNNTLIQILEEFFYVGIALILESINKEEGRVKINENIR